jgi:tRNA (adenine22-N1)-methyltransferase
MRLPPRLAKIAEFIPSGSIVADIGTDHALLPLFLLEKGIATAVIGVEVSRKPLEQAQNNLRQHPLGSKVALRLGDGLKALRDEDGVNVVVMAGMGCTTIKKILTRGLEGREKLDFILQPMTRPEELRQWLAEKGFCLTDEALAKDDGRIYEIFYASWGCGKQGMDAYSQFGPRLLENEDPLLEEYLAYKIYKVKIVLESLSRAKRTGKDALRLRFTKQLRELERLMGIVSAGK